MRAPVESNSLTWRVTPDMLGILDNNGVFIETNPAWQHTLGWKIDEILSRTFVDFLHPDDIETNTKAFAEIKMGTPILNFENRYRHKDGTYRWLSWNAVPEGENYFCSARDVTDAKMNAASLKSREEEALLREQFVAVLGHDLRNPLAAIQSAMRIMERDEQSDKNLEMINAVNGCVDRMAVLISDVMDFARARLGSGIDVADREPINFAALVEKTVNEIRLANPNRVIETDLNYDKDIKCDKARIAQLVSNLVGNAVAHGDADHPICIRMNSDNDIALLSISNKGETIPLSKQDVIFEPFYSADPEENKKGLGLGLFIASQIAKAHKGRMSVTSVDHETTFTLHIPAG